MQDCLRAKHISIATRTQTSPTTLVLIKANIVLILAAQRTHHAYDSNTTNTDTMDALTCRNSCVLLSVLLFVWFASNLLPTLRIYTLQIHPFLGLLSGISCFATVAFVDDESPHARHYAPLGLIVPTFTFIKHFFVPACYAIYNAVTDMNDTGSSSTTTIITITALLVWILLTVLLLSDDADVLPTSPAIIDTQTENGTFASLDSIVVQQLGPPETVSSALSFSQQQPASHANVLSTIPITVQRPREIENTTGTSNSRKLSLGQANGAIRRSHLHCSSRRSVPAYHLPACQLPGMLMRVEASLVLLRRHLPSLRMPAPRLRVRASRYGRSRNAPPYLPPAPGQAPLRRRRRPPAYPYRHATSRRHRNRSKKYDRTTSYPALRSSCQLPKRRPQCSMTRGSALSGSSSAPPGSLSS